MVSLKDQLLSGVGPPLQFVVNPNVFTGFGENVKVRELWGTVVVVVDEDVVVLVDDEVVVLDDVVVVE